MGVGQFQLLCARLYTDDAFRASFLADRRAFIEQQRLDDEEAGMLLAMSQRELILAARSLKRKRLGEVATLLPTTADILGKEFSELFFSYTAERDLEQPSDHVADALAFSTYLANKLSGRQGVEEALVALQWETLGLRHHSSKVSAGLLVLRGSIERSQVMLQGSSVILLLRFRALGQSRGFLRRIPLPQIRLAQKLD